MLFVIDVGIGKMKQFDVEDGDLTSLSLSALYCLKSQLINTPRENIFQQIFGLFQFQDLSLGMSKKLSRIAPSSSPWHSS